MQNETIVDRVVQRLKAAPLGDLITEEDLHDIVKTAIPKAFFERRKEIDRSGYSPREIEKEPAVFEVMRELLRESARKAVEEWLAANADVVVAHWKKVTDDGLFKYVSSIQDELATGHLKQALYPIFQKLNEERMRNGMPSITI